ncbi:MAG: DUF805 domain-containing protein [Pseudomonadota bacterium]
MKQIAQAFENFAFKAFDFSGRATRLEYWAVIPVIWGLIIYLAIGDVQEFWSFLLRRQVPPLNPLYWDAIVVFLLTIIPRLSLTVRRLHDGGKSGRWAKLPYICLITSIWLVLGVASALLTSNIGRGGGEALAAMSVFAVFAFSSVDSAWSAIFGMVAVLNAMGWDAIIAILAELFGMGESVNINRGIASPSGGLSSDPLDGGTVGLVIVVMIALPFVTGMLHLMFMLNPGLPEDQQYGHHKIAGATLRQRGEISENPFAGYKYLQERSPDEEAARKQAAKEEVRALYQSRVLGRS